MMKLNSIVKYVLGRVRLIGNSDGGMIGNVGDRMKVDTGIPARGAGKTTIIVLNATSWTALPAAAVVGRRWFDLTVASGVANVNFQQPLANEGLTLTKGACKRYDQTEAITLYGRAKTGTSTVVVEELS